MVYAMSGSICSAIRVVVCSVGSGNSFRERGSVNSSSSDSAVVPGQTSILEVMQGIIKNDVSVGPAKPKRVDRYPAHTCAWPGYRMLGHLGSQIKSIHEHAGIGDNPGQYTAML